MKIIQASNVMLTSPAHARLPHAPQFEDGSAFSGGKYSSYDDATVPMSDLGFTQADGAYDVVSASRGYFFRLEDHLNRFESSCERFRLTNPYTRSQTVEILTNLLKLAGTKDAYIWWAVTRGHMPDGNDRINPKAYENRFYAFVVPYLYIADDEKRTRGIDLQVSKKFIRIPANSVDPRAKNFHWMDLKLSLFEANDNKREWSVLCDADGYLTEAPGANIFFTKDGTLYTPDNGCLEGITRQTTLELAREIGMPIHEGRVHVDKLHGADEAFITSTAGGIMPINTVDGKVLGGADGPGKLVTQLHNLYWEKRWDGWLGTPVNYEGTVPSQS
ncbi:branched chain amino acid aminotransferase apoenzyme [Burkholderia sp. OK233]|nr:branched chain amino acid aminotransferase apoenzyme [Burkholderia sp. OK233]